MGQVLHIFPLRQHRKDSYVQRKSFLRYQCDIAASFHYDRAARSNRDWMYRLRYFSAAFATLTCTRFATSGRK